MIEYGIYIHKNVPKSAHQWAANFREACERIDPNTFFREFADPGDLAYSPKTQKAVVVGGDGTIRMCLEWWDRINTPELVGIKAFGTHNVLNRALTTTRVTENEDTFLMVKAEDFASIPSFRVGQTASLGGGHLFTNTMSMSQFDRMTKKTERQIRNHLALLPGRDRLKAAYLVGLVATALKIKDNAPTLNMVLATPFYGVVNLCPDQDPFGSQLTRVSIENESKEVMFRKLMKAFVAFYQGRIPSKGVLKFESGREFTLSGNSLTLDGDLLYGSPKVMKVTRGEKSLKIVALT